jgi:hypothetical protein
MDSPSFGSIAPPAPPDRAAEAGEAGRTEPWPGAASRGDLVLVADLGDPVAADFAAHVGRGSRGHALLIADETPGATAGPPVRSRSLDECLRPDSDARDELGSASGLIVFVGPRLTEEGRRKAVGLVELARRCGTRFIGIVGSFRVHLDDPDSEEAEQYALSLFGSGEPEARVVVFRPGHVISPHSRVSRFLKRFAPLYPLFPGRLSTCFIEGEELFAAIESERVEADGPGIDADADAAGRDVGRDRRAYTLLGANLPWRDRLLRHRVATPGSILATAVAKALSWLLVGQLIAVVVSLSARWSRAMRPWHVHTLKPRSMRELISLCHRMNRDHVRVVGYNNGVNHFGHRYPEKTIVSTVRCRRAVRDGRGRLKADCGTTIRGALDHLAATGEELYVVPNYSYVSLGTAFFVPIHGSAIDFSTVADTIDRVVLYDPDRDRIVSASRDEADFAENVYNLKSRVVVLRLYLRAKPKSGYYVRSQTLTDPSASDLLGALGDREATNVEIRQGHAASPRVTVRKYYKEPGETSAPALELPRDALGRLWDRLEENPLTSFLMHALSRHLAWHTELFFTAEEFDVFWRTHARVPLRKIQLRYIRRDGMPNSPFRDEDRVSADLFLFRTDKPRFDEYIRSTLPAVRTNPGKHSH